MRKMPFLVACVLGCALAGGASAQQFNPTPDINDGFSTGSSYIGTGFIGSSVGASFDGGRDAFDTYGVYSGSLNGLLFARQTEFIAGENIYRYYDTFYNFTGSAISTSLTFGGDLGSDADGDVGCVGHPASLRAPRMPEEGYVGLRTPAPGSSHPRRRRARLSPLCASSSASSSMRSRSGS